jgi:hypothetical protein
MKTLLTFIALALPLCAQQGFDFKSLDKLDALTDKKTKVTLDAGMLRLAANFLGTDSDGDKDAAALKSLVGNLKGIYVRTWEFDKDGQYNPSDVEPLRAYLQQQQWSKIVESQDGKELSEVYILPLPNDRFGGVAIVSTQPRELTVVYINGVMNASDLHRLSGNMGVPSINLSTGKPHRNSAPSNGPKKQNDDDEK